MFALKPRYLWLNIAILSNPLIATELDNTVITANRIVSHPIQTPAAISVINRQQIEASHAQSLPELLSHLSGLQWVQNGGIGQASSLFMRGGNSDHVLVLIDGMRLGSATLGRTELSYLPLAHIERIEVVRGPRSGLYGSDAMGGIIQIFTRNGQSGGHVKASIGSDNTQELNAGIQASNGTTDYALNLASITSDGYNNCRGNLSSGCFTIEPDNDAYRNHSVSAQIKHQFTQDLYVRLHGLHVEGESEYDSSFQNESDFVQQSLALDTVWQINDDFQTQIKIGQSLDESDSSGHGMTHSIFNTKTAQAHWQLLWQPDEQHSINVGYDYQKDEIDSSTAFIENARDNQGIYGQYGYTGERWQLQAALRYDDNQQFGSHHTEHLGINYTFKENLQAFVSYGTAFKAPSFNNLYFPNYGNPDLKPEQLTGIELGVRGQNKQNQWALSIFHHEIDELIGGFFDANTQVFLAKNIKQAKIVGLELENKYHWGQWQLDNNLTLQKTEDIDTNTRLALRANWTFSSSLAYQWQKLRLAGQLQAQGKRYANATNSSELPSYALVNLKADYQLSNQINIGLKLNNIFDKTYETTAYYPMPARQWYLNLNYQF